MLVYLAVTWIHLVVFAVIGGVAAHILTRIGHRSNIGSLLVLSFLGIEFGFVFSVWAIAPLVLHALNWVAVVVGNLLAAAVMSLYFWRRQAHLRPEL